VSEKILMKGAEAFAEAAIKAGCRLFFGYPITPQNEAPGYMAKRMPEVGGVFLQAESEVAAINMLYGAASTGSRVITSSSSPGISLMQEGLSYIAGAQLPVVVVNVMRGGPGLGGIGPSQGDYFQATKGGGHGDYRVITFAPLSLQEQIDLIFDAFELAEKYRNPVIILSDGLLGQIMEAVEFKREMNPKDIPPKEWAATGRKNRGKVLINSFNLDPDGLEKDNSVLRKKYEEIKKNEVRVENFLTDDASVIIVAYGTVARICKTAVQMMREEGFKVGLFRPITLWPFPEKELSNLSKRENVKFFYDFELSFGQMLEDVRLSVADRKPVYFYGRTGGNVPSPTEIIDKIKETITEETNA
jgi:2-oxoglutarate ferredoxin oxidoreductase subunit alpha